MTLLTTYGTTFAADNTTGNTVKTQGAVEKTYQNQSDLKAPQKGEFERPPRGEFNGKDENFKHNGHHRHGDFNKFHPSKAEMEKKKAEFEKRLKLTDEQKKQIQENRKLGHEKVKPLMEQKQAKMQEIKKIYRDNTLTQEQKKEKTVLLKSDIKKLNEKANKYREDDMKAFENILTDKQKKEFAKIKAEQKKEMEKRKAEFSKHMEKAKQEGKRPQGFPPPPPPVEDEQ